MELRLSGKQCLNKGNEHQKEVVFLTSYQVILFRSKTIENIPLITSKIMELDLQNCKITNSNVNLVSKFINLKFLCLANNFIDTLPSSFASFGYLTFCDLSSNSFSNLTSIQILPSLHSLKYLNLSQNLITKSTKYRSQICKFCPTLLGLDFHIISDEERYPELCSFNRTKFKSCSSQLYLESFLRVSYPKQSSSHLLISHCSRLHSLQRLAAATSPLHILKRYCQKWMKYSGLQRYIPQLIRLQALIRRFIFHCRIHRAVEEVNLQNSDLEHELRMIHHAYLSEYVTVIQRKWRFAQRCKREYQSSLRLQRWWRKLIVFHRGCVRWLTHNRVRSLIFPSKFTETVMMILQQLIDASPEGCSTRAILERVAQTVSPLERVVLVKSRKVSKLWTGEKTVRIEFFFVSLPKGRRIQRNEEEEQEEDFASKTFATEIPQAMKLTLKSSWFFSPCLCYASKRQRRLLFLFKRRGCRPLRQTSLSPPLTSGLANSDSISLNRILWNSRGGRETEVGKGGRLQRIVRQSFLQHQQQKYSFWLKSFSLSQLVFPSSLDTETEGEIKRYGDDEGDSGKDSMSLLWKVYKRFQSEIFLNVEDAIPLFFDHQMRRQASIIEIQRVWRGYMKRKQISQKFIERVILSRATILLQRWWRFHNCLRRRFDLLTLIEKRCHEICDKRLYLDSLVFYRLLRVFHKPQQTPLSSCPEYQGIPVIDSKTGCVAYQPLIQSGPQENSHLSSRIKHCIPQWTSWAPSVQLSPIKISSRLNNDHKVIQDLISSHCDISLEHFPVGSLRRTHTTGEVETAGAGEPPGEADFRVIELVFSSISEAKIRCAMLMLQTYDCVSRKCVSMMTRDYVKKKIREQRHRILAGPALNRNISSSAESEGPPTANDFPMKLTSNETVPVEGQILLSDSLVTDWLFPQGLSLSTREMIRYRFLCESLSKRNTYNAANASVARSSIPHQAASVPAAGGGGGGPAAGSEMKYEKLREMIIQQLQPPLSYAHAHPDTDSHHLPSSLSLRTHRLEAVPLHSPVKPMAMDKYSEVTVSSIDERLQRHLWDSSRIVSWCADFPEEEDKSSKHKMSPRNKSKSNVIDEQTQSSSWNYSNVDHVVASRLDLIQLSQYERVMTAISPKRYPSSASCPAAEAKSRSPSPPKVPAAAPLPILEEEAIHSPRLPRPLSPNNPRHQFEQSHRKKIQEIRQKNFQTQQEHQKKEELLKQSKESQIQSQKQEQQQGQQKIQDWKTKRSQSAQSNHVRERETQRREREERELQTQERKMNQIKIVREQKKSQRFHLNQKKEIQNAHAILFAMARHGAKSSSQRQEDQELTEKREQIRQKVANRISQPKRTSQQQQQRQQQATSHQSQSPSRPHSAVQFHRMFSEFEDRENQQKEKEFKYQRTPSAAAGAEGRGKRQRRRRGGEDIDNDSISSNDSSSTEESFPLSSSHPHSQQQQVRISIGAISVEDGNSEATSLIDLGSPRVTKLREELFMKSFPSFKNQIEDQDQEEDRERGR